MIQHYCKIAFRNILKYKTQSIISIIGLAVGFTCFALSNLWIHYEITYDKFYEGVERTHLLYQESTFNESTFSTYSSYMLATTLRQEFPEVEAVCAVYQNETELKTKEGKNAKVNCIYADSTFLEMFRPSSILSGSMEFLYSDNKIALTEETAMSLFGSTEVLGQEIEANDAPKTVCAILKNVEKHSNLYFAAWTMSSQFQKEKSEWGVHRFQTYVRLRKGVDATSFQEKMKNYESGNQWYPKPLEKYKIIPLTQYHYSAINEKLALKFNYLVLFSIASGMIILCALFNYLSLFITRMRTRNREIELRKVCGSSIRNLFILFGTEYLFVLLLSGLVGMTLIELSLPKFRELSEINGDIYGESFLYFIGILFISYILLIPFIVRRYHRQSGSLFRFRKCSIAFQLIICILFIFCVSILMKQLNHLANGNIGWERKNTAVLRQYVSPESYAAVSAEIDKMPCIVETLKGCEPLFPRYSTLTYSTDSWEGKKSTDKADRIDITCIREGREFINFYNLKLIEGEMLKPDDADKAIINETCARRLGLDNPIGKKINIHQGVTIVGIVKDFHITAPTIPAAPTLFCNKGGLGGSVSDANYGDILIKYRAGTWDDLKQRVDDVYTKISTGSNEYHSLLNIEEEYSKFLKSETLLLKLLGFASIICVLIAAFGIFSFITLSCEQRRKEIAIRKVNGASVKEILTMFVKEYFILLVAASVIAFPIGYALMKKWLESYIEQTAISVWIYLAIFCGIGLLILLCIGWRVWQAAQQNPAEVIKSE